MIMTKLERPVVAGHFYGLRAYRSTEKKLYSNLNESLVEAIHI